MPADQSHATIDAASGLQKDYVVLTAAERAKGFVKPVRDSYVHSVCGVVTHMHGAIAETYARDPRFYSGTFCRACRVHRPLSEFQWVPDGEPMDPDRQDEWLVLQRPVYLQRFIDRLAEIDRQIAGLTEARAEIEARIAVCKGQL